MCLLEGTRFSQDRLISGAAPVFNYGGMAFSEFQGNGEVVGRLREMLARDRFPHAIILAGPQGAGKYTLALMLARTMNCLGIGGSGEAFKTDGLPDYCGRCENCRRSGQAEDLDARFAEAV